MSSSEPEYIEDGLIQAPRVVVKSAGGRFDDESFDAGWMCATVNSLLSAANNFGFRNQVPPLPAVQELVEQIDLIAMSRGYTTTCADSPDMPEIVFMYFHPIESGV